MSYKDIIIKILTTDQVTLEELNIFLDEYITKQHNRSIDTKQLEAIVQLIQMRQLNLRFAATQSAILLNLNVLNVHTEHGQLIATYVYE